MTSLDCCENENRINAFAVKSSQVDHSYFAYFIEQNRARMMMMMMEQDQERKAFSSLHISLFAFFQQRAREDGKWLGKKNCMHPATEKKKEP